MYTRVQQLHRPEIETVCSEQRDKLMHRAVITMQGSESARKRERELQDRDREEDREREI